VSIETLLPGYQLCAVTEGKSRNATLIVSSSVRYFRDFLVAAGQSPDVQQVTPRILRAYILYLQQKQCFASHRFNRPQDKGLSGHTINCYLRSLRIFFSWLVSEEIIAANPFDRVKIPRPPRKVIPVFSDSQIRDLLAAIDMSTAEGVRDYTIVLTLLDAGLRVSELCQLTLAHVWLEEGMVKVLGKGNKERLVPIGRQVQRALWHYIGRYRPEPALPRCDAVFLTRDGRPLTKDRVEKLMAGYGRKAGIAGVRCSPHTFRHAAAVKFLRNGGDVFSLQRMLGHSSLEMTRRYCELADIDVKRAHVTASPVDNLGLRQPAGQSGVRPSAKGRSRPRTGRTSP
jgi:site-specific recombinase XerD